MPPGAGLDDPGRLDSTGVEAHLRFGRLQQINVPPFSGRREEWESFRDLFRAIIHGDPRLSDVAKLYYLKTLVQGEARAALETLKLTDANYTSAWRLLQSRYEHRRLLVQDHLNALRALRPLREESSAGLRGLLDTLNRHRDQLLTLQRPVDSWDDWFISIAASCMDSSTRRDWEDELEKLNPSPFEVTAPVADSSHIEEPMATYSKLSEFIQRRCNTISCVEADAPAPQPRRSAGGQSSSRGPRSFATRAMASQCVQCQGNHYIGHCERFLNMPPDTRRDVVTRERLCFNCLRPGHAARSCLSKSVCQLCQALHHSLLHNSDRKRTAAAEDVVPPKQAKSSTTGAETAESSRTTANSS